MSESVSRMLSLAAQSSSVSITIADARQRDVPLVYVNPAFERLTGYSSKEVVGRNCRFLQGPQTDREAVRAVSEAIAGRRSATTNLLNYRKNGTAFWNRFQLSPIFENGDDLVGYLGVQIDMTQDATLATTEVARARLEGLGQLAGGVAHDLANTIQPILLLAEQLGYLVHSLPEEEKRREAERSLEIMLEHAKLGQSIVSQVLNYASRQPARGAPVDLLPLVRNAVEFAKHQLPKDTELQMSPGMDIHALGARTEMDETTLRLIFMNLFNNAAQAFVGPGRMTVEARRVALNDREGTELGLLAGAYGRIDVSDNGSGIPTHSLPHIFDPFFTTKPAGKGTGIGLYAVRGLLRDRDGTISAASTSGQGTTFSIYLRDQNREEDIGLNTID